MYRMSLEIIKRSKEGGPKSDIAAILEEENDADLMGGA
jgi:hypothetical protein